MGKYDWGDEVVEYGNVSSMQQKPRAGQYDWGDEPVPMGPQRGVGVLGTAADVANQFGEGFNRQLDTMVMGPARLVRDVVRGGAEMLGLNPDAAMAGVRTIAPAFAVGADDANPISQFLRTDTEAQTGIGRLAEGAGRAVATDLPAAALSLGTAPIVTAATRATPALFNSVRQSLPAVMSAFPRVAAAAAPMATLGARSLGSIASQIAARPGAMAAGELAASSGAGAGQQAAADRGAGATGQMLAALAGAAAPSALAVMPAALAARGGRAIAARLAPSAQNRNAELEAGRALRTELELSDQQTIDAARELAEEIPGLNLSLAETTQNPRLIAKSADIGRRLDAEQVQQEAARRAGNIDAIANVRRNYESGVRGFDRLLRQERQSSEGLIDRQREGLNRALDPEGSPLAPTDRAETGSRIRELVEGRRQATREEMGRVADEAGLNDPQAIPGFDVARDAMVRAFRGPTAIQSTRNAFPDLTPTMQIIADAADTQSFEGLTQMRSQLSAELRALQRSPTPLNAQQQRGVAAALQELDDYIDTAARFMDDPQRAQAYNAFRARYRQEFVERFRQGPGRKVTQRTPQGDYATKDEKVAATFFGPGKQTELRRFAEIFDDATPEGREAYDLLARAASDDAYRAAVVDGAINPARLERWWRTHQRDLPEPLRRRIAGVGDLHQRISTRQAEFDIARARASEAEWMRMANQIEAGTPPEQVIDNLLRSPQYAASVKRRVSTYGAGDRELLPPELRNIATREVIFDRAIMSRTLYADDPVGYFNKNRASLEAVLPPAAFRRLSRIIEATQRINTIPMPDGKPIGNLTTVAGIEEFLNMGLNQVSSRIFAVQSGRTSARYMATEMAGRMLRGFSARDADRLLMRAMTDSELAARLTAAVRRPTERRLSRLYTYLATIPILPETEDERGR